MKNQTGARHERTKQDSYISYSHKTTVLGKCAKEKKSLLLIYSYRVFSVQATLPVQTFTAAILPQKRNLGTETAVEQRLIKFIINNHTTHNTTDYCCRGITTSSTTKLTYPTLLIVIPKETNISIWQPLCTNSINSFHSILPHALLQSRHLTTYDQLQDNGHLHLQTFH